MDAEMWKAKFGKEWIAVQKEGDHLYIHCSQRLSIHPVATNAVILKVEVEDA